jgi:phospholipid/cholesterol/gamma-HCH transport system substrate-binding protein
MELHVRYVLVGLFVLVLTLAGLSFALWIQNRGSVQEKLHLIVRFEGAASGLRVGAPVTFNGVRIGEVGRLEFDRNDLDAVNAHIDVDAQAPITTTTQAVLEQQGWLGNASVALSGGDRNQPIDKAKGDTVLIAQSSKALGQEARETLQALRSLATDNADGIRDSVSNIRNFSDVLSRNGERVENIIKGLEKTLGGGGSDVKPAVYDLALPKIDTKIDHKISIAIADPTVAASFESQRVMGADANGEIKPTAVQFTDMISKLIQRRLIQALENAGLETVGTAQDVTTADAQMAVDLRNFQINDGKSATIALGLRLMGADNKSLGQKVFEAKADVQGEEPKDMVAALNEAFAQVLNQIVPWLSERAAHVETKKGAVEAPVE